jgi:hypothetical protein
MYYIKQKQTVKRRFFGTKTIYKRYNFNSYNDALKFALTEQIDTFFYEVSEGITTVRKPFNIFMTVKEFVSAARKNPFHFTGTHNLDRISCIESIYFNKLEKNQLQTLRKH